MNWKNRERGQHARTFEPQSWGPERHPRWKSITRGISAFVRRFIRDSKLFIALGLSMGVLFCVVALVILFFRGHRPFDANHVSVMKLLGAYLLSGALGGLVVALTLPLARWMLGAALMAFLVMFLVWFVVGLSISEQKPILAIVRTSVVLAAAFGLPLGVGFWFQERRFQRTGKWM
jgi:hypothetical protein